MSPEGHCTESQTWSSSDRRYILGRQDYHKIGYGFIVLCLCSCPTVKHLDFILPLSTVNSILLERQCRQNLIEAPGAVVEFLSSHSLIDSWASSKCDCLLWVYLSFIKKSTPEAWIGGKKQTKMHLPESTEEEYSHSPIFIFSVVVCVYGSKSVTVMDKHTCFTFFIRFFCCCFY